MDGLFRGKGAKGLKEYEHLPELHRLRENRYRKDLFLVKGEEIVTVEVADFELHAKTTIGSITLTEDGRLIEDGVCFDDETPNNDAKLN